MTLTQAKKRLAEAKQELIALQQEIDELRYLLSDLGDTPVQRDLRARDKAIYRDWIAIKKLKGTEHWLKLTKKYKLGPDRLREIYNQQKALMENKKL